MGYVHVDQILTLKKRIENIIFSGGFIRNNAYVWSKISFGLGRDREEAEAFLTLLDRLLVGQSLPSALHGA